MSDVVIETYSVPLPDGDLLRLLPETDADQPFVKALFFSTRRREMGLDGDMAGLEPLLEMQYRSREHSYAAMWPGARRRVIEHDGSSVGYLIEGDTDDAVHIIDIALLPQVQGQGLGSALVADVQARAAATGRGVSAMVMVSNVASLALFRRRGFIGAAQHGAAQIGVRWTP